MRTMRLVGLLTLCGLLAIGSQVRADDWKDESGHGHRGGPPPWAGRGRDDDREREFLKKLEERQREDAKRAEEQWREYQKRLEEDRKRYEERLREDEKRRREAEREYRKRIEEARKGLDRQHGYAPTSPYPSPAYNGDQSWIGVPGLDAGYDEWRRNADRAYGRGDFHIQGWQHRPYPYVNPDYGPSPYGWPRYLEAPPFQSSDWLEGLLLIFIAHNVAGTYDRPPAQE